MSQFWRYPVENIPLLILTPLPHSIVLRNLLESGASVEESISSQPNNGNGKTNGELDSGRYWESRLDESLQRLKEASALSEDMLWALENTLRTVLASISSELDREYNSWALVESSFVLSNPDLPTEEQFREHTKRTRAIKIKVDTLKDCHSKLKKVVDTLDDCWDERFNSLRDGEQLT